MLKNNLFLFFLSLSFCGIGQTTFLDSILHDQLQRKYVVHLPTDYDAANPHDLVFVLHGGTGSANFMMNFTGFNDLSDQENFIVVYPQGIFTGNTVLGVPGHHWADGRTTTLPDVQGVDDVGFISNLIDLMASEYNIDLGNVFATGISNGGYMVQRLACELSERLSAVATVAATFPDSLAQYCVNPDPISILVMNGTNDIFVPTNTGGMATGTGGYVSSTQEMIDIWINNNNCGQDADSLQMPDLSITDQSAVTKFTYSDCVDSTSIVYFKILGGGHTWPGEVIHVPFTGVTNEDINANEEIWQFFKSQSDISNTEENIKEDHFNIYPNPFVDFLTIEWTGDYNINQIDIFDAHLRKIDFRTVNHPTNGYMSISGAFTTGLYLIKISTDHGTHSQKLLVTEHR